MAKQLGYYFLLGLALVSLFFYPLVASLADGAYYMQWQLANTFELTAVALAGAVACGALIAFADRLPSRLLGSALIVAVSLVPLASFGIHAVRQLKLDALPKKMAGIKLGGLGLTTILLGTVLLLLALLVIRWRDRIGRYVVTALLVASPLSFVMAVTILQHGTSSVPVVLASPFAGPAGSEHKRGLPRDIYVFLFDELDYDFLYEDGRIRAEYPHLRAFSASAANFHAARAPGQQTLTSMPGLLLGRQAGDIEVCGPRLCDTPVDGDKTPLDMSQDNLFQTARSLGYRTSMIGWVHPYCAQFGAHLDNCRSFSLYNHASVNTSFSLLNPILTNVILWPYQFPFGLAKIPAYTKFQHRIVSASLGETGRMIDRDGPVFSFTHFSIPHIPFVYDGDRFAPPAQPFLQNRENYVRQLAYVDKLFGELVQKLKSAGKYSSATIVVLSDHAYRILAPAGQWNRVPLLVRDGANPGRRDIEDPAATEEVLAALLGAGR